MWLDTHLDELTGGPQVQPDRSDELLSEARAFDVEVNGKRFSVSVRSHEETIDSRHAQSLVVLRPPRAPPDVSS